MAQLKKRNPYTMPTDTGSVTAQPAPSADGDTGREPATSGAVGEREQLQPKPLRIPGPAAAVTRSNKAPAGMVRITANVDPEEWRQFRMVAISRGTSGGELLRAFIADTVRRHGSRSAS